VPQLQRFRCYWCNRVLGPRRLHHEQELVSPTRRCCNECAGDPDSPYRLIYPGGPEEEAKEIGRVQADV